MIGKHSTKSGAALVIALGFLAILTVMIIAFSALTRSERLAARSYLSSAQTRQLLHSALNRAMLDIDAAAGTNYPSSFFALGSIGDEDDLLADTVNFDLAEAYFQNSTNGLRQAYLTGRSTAAWETIAVQDTAGQTKPIGRIGYVVINSSGFLDANTVGGASERGPGLSPREIRLRPELLPEMNAEGEFIRPDGSSSAAPDSGAALAYNRDNTWHRFETLRDLWQLNTSARGNLINGPIQSFSTFSHSLSTNNARTFMGTNEVALNIEFLENELDAIPGVESEFVLQQLLDYLDEDTIPQDLDDEYSDLSVEPVPMINELALICRFTFLPNIDFEDDGNGNEIPVVTSVTITNRYSVEMEVWYPFVGYTNQQTFTLSVTDPPIESGQIDSVLFGVITDWTTDEDIPADLPHPDNREDPYEVEVYNYTAGTEASDAADLISLFETMQSDIQFPTLVVTDENGDKVDQVLALELPMVDVVGNELLPAIEALSTNLFDGETAVEVSNQFTVGMACIDPRLNWDGSNPEQWQEYSGLDDGIDSIGEVNQNELESVETTDAQNMLYVRNQDRIDSPWELTYLLYNSSYPWRTFQMLEAYDRDNTRTILQNLTTLPEGPARAGRINPFSPHTNVIASVFMEMPINEFMGSDGLVRLEGTAPEAAAQLFMRQMSDRGWQPDPSRISDGTSISDLQRIMTGETNPWILESFYRNSLELFDPDDTLYTILLAAQSGTDIDGNGIISNTEIRSTEQAVVYVWRDRGTGKAAVVFFGLNDTLQSTIAQGQTWGEILQAFQP